VTPEEYDAGAAAGRFRPLARAAGDMRSGRALLADWTTEQGTTFDRLAGTAAGREAVRRLAEAVRAAFAPGAAYLRQMEAAATGAAAWERSVQPGMAGAALDGCVLGCVRDAVRGEARLGARLPPSAASESHPACHSKALSL
jgi:hypothetical protein